MFLAFLRLGLTSFGGPAAHFGYFRQAFVQRRRWLDDARFAELISLSQLLPGPASSQLGMAIGLQRAGHAGMVAAWLGFTLPSALLMLAFALLVIDQGDALQQGWLTGMRAAAVAVVAHAVLGMARTLAAGWRRAMVALLATAAAIFAPTAAAQITIIALGALAGWRLLASDADTNPASIDTPQPGLRFALAALAAYALLLVALPLAATQFPDGALALFAKFYRAGALVFGGGHVVLPLLQAEVVEPGLVAADDFLAGYGAAQAVPGPLFSFAAYLGALAQPGPGGAVGAALAVFAIFLPSMLLIAGMLPLWGRLRRHDAARRAIAGINAAVVGLLAAVLWRLLRSEGLPDYTAALIAAVAFVLLLSSRVPAWAVVIGAAAAGSALYP